MSQSQYALDKKEILKMRNKSHISDIENEKTYVNDDDVATTGDLIIGSFIEWCIVTMFSVVVIPILSLIAFAILKRTTSYSEDFLTEAIVCFGFVIYLSILIFATVMIIYFYIKNKKNYVTYKNNFDNDFFNILNKPIVLTNESKVDRLWHYLNVEQSTTDTLVFDLGKKRPFKFINAYPKFESDDYEIPYYQEAIAHHATFVEKMDVSTYQHIYDIIQANEDRKQQEAEQNRKAKAYNDLSPNSVDEQRNSQVMQSLQRLKQSIEEGQSNNKQNQKDAFTKNENILNHIDENE